MRDAVRKLRHLLTRRDRRLAALLLVMMVFGATLEMIGVGAIPAFVALLSNPSGAAHVPVVGKRWFAQGGSVPGTSLVLRGAAVLLCIFVVKNLFISALTLLQARFATNRQIQLAKRLLSAYLASPYTFHLQRNSAELLRNANNESLDVVGSVLMPGLTLTLESLTVIAILSLLLYIEPLISLTAFALLGGSTVIFIRLVRRRLQQYGAIIQQQRLLMIKSVTESLGGIKLTKVLGRERYYLNEYGRYADAYAQASRYRQIMLELPRLFLETIAVFGLLGIAALLLFQKRPLDEIIPTLSLLGVAIVRMIPSFNRITSSLTTIRFGMFSLNVVYEDLRSLERRPADEHRNRTVSFTRSLRLHDVSYLYPGANSPSLRNVNITLRKGETIGLVGSTGAGKTTLVDVILGLLEPTTGTVYIDDTDIRQNVGAWQRHIGYVAQDIFLTDASIRQNVALGLDEASIDDDLVMRAVDAAQLREFIDSLPAGIETIVGERGVRLSGGQRQRIGIARALYHEPDVLVFDEATSSLDNETERFVMEAVESLRGSRTIIMIAHRLSTVRKCDRLYLLSNGSVTAEGRFEDLLHANKAFQALAGVV